jgi:hypothetical protein
MSTPKEGGASVNIVPVSLRRAPEQGRFHGVKTPEAMRQQAADAAREAGRAAAKELLGKRWGATVYENPIRVPRPLPRNTSEQGREAQPFEPNLKEQQAREQLGKPPPESVREEVQLEPAPIHQEYPVDSLDEFKQLARQALIPPVSPEQLELAKPENAANYAAEMRQFDEAVEFLAQSMAEDPLQFTANIIRRYLREREEQPKSPEESLLLFSIE